MKLTNKDFQHSITVLGVNKQSSLYIRSLPNRLLTYFFNDYFNQVIAQKDVTTSNVNYVVTE